LCCFSEPVKTLTAEKKAASQQSDTAGAAAVRKGMQQPFLSGSAGTGGATTGGEQRWDWKQAQGQAHAQAPQQSQQQYQQPAVWNGGVNTLASLGTRTNSLAVLHNQHQQVQPAQYVPVQYSPAGGPDIGSRRSSNGVGSFPPAWAATGGGGGGGGSGGGVHHHHTNRQADPGSSVSYSTSLDAAGSAASIPDGPSHRPSDRGGGGGDADGGRSPPQHRTYPAGGNSLAFAATGDRGREEQQQNGRGPARDTARMSSGIWRG
ncbi:unnamed protein product, partial [Scytosiphon promiscuus]